MGNWVDQTFPICNEVKNKKMYTLFKMDMTTFVRKQYCRKNMIFTYIFVVKNSRFQIFISGFSHEKYRIVSSDFPFSFSYGTLNNT